MDEAYQLAFAALMKHSLTALAKPEPVAQAERTLAATAVDKPTAATETMRALALPRGRRRAVLVLPLKATGGVAEHVPEILTSIMLANLERVRGLRTISSNDIQATLEAERASDLLGCTNATCLAEIGGALGADMVAYGAVGKLGSKLSVSVSMFDNRTSTVVARSSRVCDREEGLPDAAQLVVTDLVTRADWSSRQ
jgi:TolB-like protein